MFVANRVLGNTKEDENLALDVQRRTKLGEIETVEIDFHDAARRRLRVNTVHGEPVGIVLGDANALQDGDVITNDEDDSKAIIIQIASREAMALRMSAERPASELFEFGVRLGHMLGNQHWPLEVKDDVVYTPVSISRKVMETVIKTHGFEGIAWDFVEVKPGDIPSGMPDIDDHGHSHSHEGHGHGHAH